MRPLQPVIARPLRPSFLVAALLLVLLTGGGCADTSAQHGDEMIAGAGDWEVLFDGSSLDAWKGYGREDIPSGWGAEDGTLHFTPGAEGGDLVTKASYGDFELEIEWRIGACGNSGIFYWGAEGQDHIWENAPEMQVLDDTCHPDNRYPSHRAGSNYDLYMATPGVVKPAGEWNQVRIVARGGHVEHWLNGQKVVSYEHGSDEWRARVAVSKFRDMPDYGSHVNGIVGLQDHGDPVWFRNIRIRRLG